nr:hypothetical protein [Tanacetum cinerariifolium]
MSSQQDIYAVGSENRPPMLNKDNYVPWSSRIIRYARSRPNGKMIVYSIENEPYVRQMIATTGEPDLPVPVPESFHEQIDEELTETDIKRMDADDQAIQTILLGLPEDFILLNKHFPENIALNLKFLNNLQPEWKRHDEVNELRAECLAKSHDPLALMDHSQNSSNFPTTHKDQSSSSTHPQQSFPINKYNPQPSLNQNFMQPPMTSFEDINDLTEVINAALILFAKALQLTASTNNIQRTSSNPHNRQIALSVMNMGQDRLTHNVRGNGGNKFGQYAGQVAQNQQRYNAQQNGIANQSGTGNVVAARAEGTGNGNQARCYNCIGLGYIVRNCTARPKRRDAAYLQTQLLIAQKEEAGIQLQAEEFDFMAAAGDLDEIEEVNANYILMANLQQTSTFGTQHDKAPVYDTDGSAEVHLNDNFYDNEIFNMFTQGEQYMDLLELITEPQLVPQNDNHVTFVASSMVQSGDLKSLAKEVDGSLDKQKSLELKIERLLKASVSHDIMSSDLQTELDRTKEKLELCIIKKEKEYDVLWNNCASKTLDSLNQKLESKIVELEFQVVNYEREISHLKTTYKNLFESIKSNRAHAKLHDLIYKNAQLRAMGFEKTSESLKNTPGTSVTPHVDKPKLSAVTPLFKKLHASTPSHSVPQPREFNVMKHRNLIAPEMFNINPSQTTRVDLVPNKQSSASIRTNPITNSQRHVTIKENVSSDTVVC